MIINIFQCNDETCTNFGVTYNMETTEKEIMCGGCSVTLISIESKEITDGTE